LFHLLIGVQDNAAKQQADVLLILLYRRIVLCLFFAVSDCALLSLSISSDEASWYN